MDLIAAIKHGDETAFEQAYTIWRKKGFYYFLRKTTSEEDSKDLLQNTFLKLWQYRSSLSLEHSLDEQLFRIARTVFIDYLRKSNNLSKTKDQLSQDLVRAGSENSQTFEFDTKARLNQLLDAMPFIRKRVFELHKLDGYSYKEVAESLGINEKSVDNHLAKAIKVLRKSFILFFLFILISSH